MKIDGYKAVWKSAFLRAKMGEWGSGALTLATLDFEWGSCHTRLPHVYCVFEWVNSVLQHCTH